MNEMENFLYLDDEFPVIQDEIHALLQFVDLFWKILPPGFQISTNFKGPFWDCGLNSLRALTNAYGPKYF